MRQNSAPAAQREQPPAPIILFTCTSHLALPGKFAQCAGALASIHNAHSTEELAKISRFLLINEYADVPLAACQRALSSAFPQVAFVQKQAHEQGQAASLNIILNQLQGVDLWIHWEESWVCRAPFIAAAADIMARTDITQLQISEDIWYAMGSDRVEIPPAPAPAVHPYARVSPDRTFLQILPELNLDSIRTLWNRHGLEVIWPLYSLRPSVNRAPFYKTVGTFDTRPQLWPHIFEWEYGMRWLKAGAKKAILLPAAAVRQAGHQSTHALRGVARGQGLGVERDGPQTCIGGA